MAVTKMSAKRNFKLITGRYITDIIQTLSEAGNGKVDAEKFENDLEVLGLGLYYMDTLPIDEAIKAYKKTIKSDERYDILDTVDTVELYNNVFK